MAVEKKVTEEATERIEEDVTAEMGELSARVDGGVGNQPPSDGNSIEVVEEGTEGATGDGERTPEEEFAGRHTGDIEVAEENAEGATGVEGGAPEGELIEVAEGNAEGAAGVEGGAPKEAGASQCSLPSKWTPK